ncbi:aldo/keto reductase [Secundilactobacillus silagei]
MAALAEQYHVAVADIATAWVIQKGTTPIIGVTKQHYIADTKRAISLTLTVNDMHDLESLADQARVDTRASWEQNMKQ